MEDSGLLGIRSRGHFNRTLPPMDKSNQVFWEYANYALAILALAIVAIVQRVRRRTRRREYQQLLAA